MTSTISQPAVRSGTQHSKRDPHAAQPRSRLRSAKQRQVKLPASDKLRPPCSNVPLIERPRVTRLIGRATAEHRVTLVCGAWAASSAETASVGWLSLDYGDRWPRQLWAHVRLALANTVAVPAEFASDLPDPEDDAFPLRLAQLAHRLTRPLTLVVDDISDLAGASVLAGMDQLIRHAPPTLRLVLSGRHPA